jgi:hypothetical protein
MDSARAEYLTPRTGGLMQRLAFFHLFLKNLGFEQRDRNQIAEIGSELYGTNSHRQLCTVDLGHRFKA